MDERVGRDVHRSLVRCWGMQTTIEGTALVLVQADITTLAADAVVNAANAALAGGGGVDGAIHRAGGPSIMAACRALPFVAPHVKCPTGEVRTTTAGELQATWVLHAVGPIYDSRAPDASADLLARAYRSSLEEAVRLEAKTIAFPSLSTGAYRFPLRPAAGVALGTVAAFLRAHPGALDQVTFALFAAKDLEVYRTELERLLR
jgi:O-acetyl-ADP-ribose deacetylase (regulator of RNase III)